MAKYREIKRALRERIASGEFKSGDAIPPERFLLEQYQVSRITVRHAIAGLVNEGLLETVQGKGTFVRTNSKNLDLVSLTSCSEDIRRLGYEPRKQVLRSEILHAPSQVAEALKLPHSSLVYMLCRVYFANEETVNYTTSYLVSQLFPGLEKYDFAVSSLYGTLLNVYGLKISHARRQIKAVSVPPDVAKYLQMEPETPILLFHSVTFGDLNGQLLPFEVYTSWYRSDKYTFFIDQA